MTLAHKSPRGSHRFAGKLAAGMFIGYLLVAGAAGCKSDKSPSADGPLPARVPVAAEVVNARSEQEVEPALQIISPVFKDAKELLEFIRDKTLFGDWKSWTELNPVPKQETVVKAWALMQKYAQAQADEIFTIKSEYVSYFTSSGNWRSGSALDTDFEKRSCKEGCFRGDAAYAMLVAENIIEVAYYMEKYGEATVEQAKALEEKYGVPLFTGAEIISNHGAKFVQHACEIGLIPNTSGDYGDIATLELLVNYGEKTVKLAMKYAIPDSCHEDGCRQQYDRRYSGSELEAYCEILSMQGGENLVRAAKKAGIDLTDDITRIDISNFGAVLYLKAVNLGLISAYFGESLDQDGKLELLKRFGETTLLLAMRYSVVPAGDGDSPKWYNGDDVSRYCQAIYDYGPKSIALARSLGYTDAEDAQWAAKGIKEFGFAKFTDAKKQWGGEGEAALNAHAVYDVLAEGKK